MAATAMCVAVATEASAQTTPHDPYGDRTVVLNNQLQLGDVISGQTLDVYNPNDQVTVSGQASGNSIYGSTEGQDITLRSTQNQQGNVRATTDLTLTGDVEGVVHVSTQATGNYIAASAHGSELYLESDQTVGEVDIVANTNVYAQSARLLGGGSINSTAIANTAVLEGTSASLTGDAVQRSAATVRAGNLGGSYYNPGSTHYSGQAIANAFSAISDGASNQNLTTRQYSYGEFIESDVSGNAANSSDLSASSSASGNHASFYNAGGSLITRTEQDNGSRIRSNAIVTSFDYGGVYANASGVGNAVSVGNNDVYVEIDNSQLNSGGVEVSASFEGTNGYDSYVTADAVGNSITGYACSTCDGIVNATNYQTNSGNVSATANTTVRGASRAVITGTTATGNAATFYVARPGYSQ